MVCALAFALTSCGGERTATLDPAAKAHIVKVADSLPQGSSMRETLLAGDHGSGVHKPWMDHMREFGVKAAFLEVRGIWKPLLGFRPEAIEKIIYRRAYDGPDVQIEDTNQLAKIRTSKLEKELTEAAFKKAKRATWIGIDSGPRNGQPCFVGIYLYDDEWLADNSVLSDSPLLSRYDPAQSPLHFAAAVADFMSVKNLLSSGNYSQQELDTALFRALTYSSDNTRVISILLASGANVNAERSDGTTLLMEAAAKLSLTAAKALLASGADVRRRTSSGSTAYSCAEQQIEQIRKANGRIPEYAPEILNLLKPNSPK